MMGTREDNIIEALRLFVDALDNAVQVLRRELGFSRTWSWDPSKIKWVKAEGQKGPYERADPQATDHFKSMRTDLKAHDGTLTRDGLFYWVFRDQATAGRKEKRPRASSPRDPHAKMETNLQKVKTAGEKLTTEQA